MNLLYSWCSSHGLSANIIAAVFLLLSFLPRLGGSGLDVRIQVFWGKKLIRILIVNHSSNFFV